MRIDTKTGTKSTVRAGAAVIDSAIERGTLWAPDLPNSLLIRINPQTLDVSSDVTRAIPFPVSVVRAEGALWVLSLVELDPSGRARLLRVDPRTGRAAGAGLELGTGVGFPAAGAGALWVPSAEHGLLKILPVEPVPGPVPPPSAARGPRRLQAGPLPSGTHTGRLGSFAFTIRLDAGWLAASVEPDTVEFAPHAATRPLRCSDGSQATPDADRERSGSAGSGTGPPSAPREPTYGGRANGAADDRGRARGWGHSRGPPLPRLSGVLQPTLRTHVRRQRDHVGL
jgi:hypothetical protein